MKPKNSFLPLFSLLLLTQAVPASASGGGATGVGGGGDAIVFDDRVVLADSFGTRILDEPEIAITLFNEPLRQELGRIRSLLVSTAAMVRREVRLPSLVDDLILGSDLRYYFASQLPELPECGTPAYYPIVPEKGTVVRVACTKGDKTWIRVDLFGRMSVREQALILLHEGLRRVSPSVPLDDIFRITSGLAVALDHWNRQDLGEHTHLNQDERSLYLTAIRTLLRLKNYGYPELSDEYLQNLGIYQRGGALVQYGAEIDGTSTLGIGVTVSKYAVIGAGSEIRHSLVCAIQTYCKLGNGALVSRVKISPGTRIELGDRSVAEDSSITLYFQRKVILATGARLSATELSLQGQDLILEAGSTLARLKNADYSKGSLFLKQGYGHLTIREGAQLDFESHWLCSGERNQFVASGFLADPVLSTTDQLTETCD